MFKSTTVADSVFTIDHSGVTAIDCGNLHRYLANYKAYNIYLTVHIIRTDLHVYHLQAIVQKFEQNPKLESIKTKQLHVIPMVCIPSICLHRLTYKLFVF